MPADRRPRSSAAIDSGEVSLEDVFDRDYQAIEGTNPVQYRQSASTPFADKHVRPVLDRTKATDSRIIGSAIGDMNGYLPTHLRERSHPQGPDPVWNDEHCRNKRILIDDTTRNALPATGRRRSRPTGWSWATSSSR